MDTRGFELIDHASDLRLRAWGTSLGETFAQACAGLWALIADPASVPLKRKWTVRASGADLEELLVNLLNEQLFSFESEGLVAGRVEGVSFAEGTGDLEAIAELSGCGRTDLLRAPSRYVKAATYHRLVVSDRMVEITLDV